MPRIFRRSILWLLPVVVIPLGALLFLQVRFLRTLEQKTVSAERNWLRNSLELVTQDLESSYRTAASAALNVPLSEPIESERIGRHFARHPVPGARAFFMMRFDENTYRARWFDTAGAESWRPDSEVEAVKMATVSWHVAHKLWRVADPDLHVDERDPKNRIILRPIVDSSLHVVGVAGVILDETLARQSMTKMGTYVLRQRYPRSGITLRVAERFPRAQPGGRDFVTQPLGFVFTNWRAGIRDTCSSPEEVAAYNFRNNMMWTGGAFVMLLGAVGLSLGAVARQMRLSQMKSDFVSNVSHELRTPLSSIRVFGEYMRLGRVEKPEKIRQYGEYIEAESRRLTQLINNILDFSKIESAEKDYRFCETDIVELVKSIAAAFEMPLRDQGVTITVTAAAPAVLPVDRDAIAQVLVNLLDNAVKYSNSRRNIEVLVADAGGEVRISVRDHGIGIPPEEQKKVFEKFYRVGSPLVHDVKGSGLGLAIVRHVVEAHGGHLEVASTPGEGSTFTVVLPRTADGASASEQGSRPLIRPSATFSPQTERRATE